MGGPLWLAAVQTGALRVDRGAPRSWKWWLQLFGGLAFCLLAAQRDWTVGLISQSLILGLTARAHVRVWQGQAKFVSFVFWFLPLDGETVQRVCSGTFRSGFTITRISWPHAGGLIARAALWEKLNHGFLDSHSWKEILSKPEGKDLLQTRETPARGFDPTPAIAETDFQWGTVFKVRVGWAAC